MAEQASGTAPPVGYSGLPGSRSMGQSGTEFFLSNYRLGKTLGIGSFGKARWGWRAPGEGWSGAWRAAGPTHAVPDPRR